MHQKITDITCYGIKVKQWEFNFLSNLEKLSFHNVSERQIKTLNEIFEARV